jgi:uncharacterized protein (DUF58 family)
MKTTGNAATPTREDSTREILKKVRRVEIKTRSVVRDLFSGEYHSAFKGRGMDFAEVREYSPGDEIRLIDWNVSARMGHPFVKVFQEERELTVVLAVDISGSLLFGSGERSKRELVTELSAVLAFSAIRNNDKVGLLLFSDQVEIYLPPEKGNAHILRIIRELLYYHPRSRGTDLALGLRHLRRALKKRAIVFVISDFLADDYSRALRSLNRRHDVVAVPVTGSWEEVLPSWGMLNLRDLEDPAQTFFFPARSKRLQRMRQQHREKQEQLARILGQAQVDHISVRTNESYILPIIRFFKQRGKRP